MAGLLDWLGDALGLGGGSRMPPMQSFGGDSRPPSGFSMGPDQPMMPPPAMRMTGPMPPMQGHDLPPPLPGGPGFRMGTDEPMMPGTPMPPMQSFGGDMRPPSGFRTGPNEPMMQQPGQPPLPPSGFRMGTDEPMMQQATTMPDAPPLPRPRPAGAAPGATDISAAAPAGGPPMLTPQGAGEAVASYKAAGGTDGEVPIFGQGDKAKGLIGKALGLSGETERSLRSAIGGAMKAAGSSSGKSPGQAFASGAGGGFEEQDKDENKHYDNKIKALDAAIKAQTANDATGYKESYLKYLNASLKEKTDRAAARDGGKGGRQAWNKPPEQLYLDGQARVNADARVKAAAKTLENAQRNGSTAQQAQAKADFDKVHGAVSAETFAALKIDPAKMANLGKGKETPHPSYTSEEEFNRYVKPGEFFTNPKDGKIYQRKMQP